MNTNVRLYPSWAPSQVYRQLPFTSLHHTQLTPEFGFWINLKGESLSTEQAYNKESKNLAAFDRAFDEEWRKLEALGQQPAGGYEVVKKRVFLPMERVKEDMENTMAKDKSNNIDPKAL